MPLISEHLQTCSEYLDSHHKADASSYPFFNLIIHPLLTSSKHLDALEASSDQRGHPISPLGFSSRILITRGSGLAGNRAFCVLLLPKRLPSTEHPHSYACQRDTHPDSTRNLYRHFGLAQKEEQVS